MGACALLTAGCDLGPEAASELEIGRSVHGVVVADHETSSCSTSVVLGLSRQIADEIACMDGDALTNFNEGNGIAFAGSAVLPYISRAGKRDLMDAITAHGGTVSINSGFRTVVQQYLLYRWYQLGRCGIPVAATPGRSNHESGRALDIGNYGEWSGRLPGFGWSQTVPGDPVHFDHVASPDNRGLDVMAFQRLWNRNHPDDPIAEDGVYGPQTGARLAQSPPDGFSVSACSPDGEYVAGQVRVVAPSSLAPGEVAEVQVFVVNEGVAKWPAGVTRLVTASPKGRDSALYDDTWPAPDQPAVAVSDVAMGGTLELRFAIRAPDEPGGYSESFALEAGEQTMRPMGLDLAVSVGDGGGIEGGCSIGSDPRSYAGGWLAMLSLAVGAGIMAGRRRRRRALVQRLQ